MILKCPNEQQPAEAKRQVLKKILSNYFKKAELQKACKTFVDFLGLMRKGSVIVVRHRRSCTGGNIAQYFVASMWGLQRWRCASHEKGTTECKPVGFLISMT